MSLCLEIHLLGDTAMLKSELIERLASEYPHLTQKDVERAVNLIFESMRGTLEKGGRVEL